LHPPVIFNGQACKRKGDRRRFGLFESGNGPSDVWSFSLTSIPGKILEQIIKQTVCVVSLFGNSLLLLVAYRKRAVLKPAEFFIVNLAISDVGMTATLFPLATPSFFAHRWLFNHAMCTFYAFCGVLFGLCSLTSLTALSTVCCMKVCYPAYGLGNSFTGFEIACGVILALSPAPPNLDGTLVYELNPFQKVCSVLKPSCSQTKLFLNQ
ncbi:opsinopsin-5-like, partial [Podarcis lilfordi]